MPESPATQTPGDTVLDDMPARGLELLGAISSNPHIRAVLAGRGNSDATHDLGWSLVLEASGYRRPSAEGLVKPLAGLAWADITVDEVPTSRLALQRARLI